MTSYIDYLESLSKKQLMVMLARQRQEESQGIAVIGVGCRFPGDLDDPRSFWAALREGRVVPTESSGPPTDSKGRARWNLDAPDLAPIADLLRSGSYLSDVDLFDADYFGISAEEAAQMDPQQRLLLEVTVQALADANLTRAELRKRRVGVFVGASSVEYPFAWLRNGLRAQDISVHTALGNTLSATSGRIGFLLGVNGPAMTVETSSSSALTAIHLAGQSLRRRECDIAIVGACQLLLSPFATAILAKPGMLSPTGRSRPFTDDADGHVRGEGCGILVLKRHQDAAGDGDLPYAIMRGSAVYQHGDRPSMAVSSAAGQKAVIEQALRSAGLEPHDVQYVEAQANGSRLGGVIEAESLAEAYGRQSAAEPSLYLGSCKANLGYLESASGAAGLIKTVLALAHAEIPPQVGMDNPDPGVAWDRTALRFADKPLAWPSGPATGARRIAGVSAFGFTGINAHVVLESAPQRPDPASAVPAPALFVLSAHNDAALAATAERLHRHLGERADWDHAAVCRTLAQGRDQLKVRHAAIVNDRAGLLAELARLAQNPAQAAPSRPGIFLAVPELTDQQLSGALEISRQSGFEALHTRISARAEALGLSDLDGVHAADSSPPHGGGPAGPASPQGAALAWALGWLDLLSAVGLQIVGADVASPYRSALADVVTSRNAGAAAPEPTTLSELDLPGWLRLVAQQWTGGAELTLSALSDRPKHGLIRLPGPVLTGSSHWPDPNIWR